MTLSTQELEAFPLSRCTTFQQSGIVPKFTRFFNLDHLQAFIKKNEPFFVIGKGSNSIINPNSKIKHMIQLSPKMFDPVLHENKITFSSGTSVNECIKYCIKNGVSGFEFTAGVPATVGGMITMNFGCWGKEISDMIDSATILDHTGNIKELKQKDMCFSYRKSVFMESRWVIIKATFNITRKLSIDIKTQVNNYVKQRLDKQPMRSKTFGSIFKNPKNDYAARLIEAAGLKGYERNNVKISEKHANFMENVKDASYEDIKEMVLFIQEKIKKQFKVELQPEVQFYQ